MSLALRRIGNGLGDFAFNTKNIFQRAIVTFGPEMIVGHRLDQLNVHVHGAARLLHAAFENVGYTELLRDLTQVSRLGLGYCLVEDREMTFRAPILARRVRISSCVPSAK